MSSKSERTRRTILETTWKLLRTVGAHVGMAEVASAAGLSRQAVYLHFPSRTSLMLELVDFVSREVGGADLFAHALEAPTARKALDASLVASARYHARIHEVALAIDVARHTDEAAAAAWQNRMAGRRRSIKQLVANLDKEGALRPPWTLDDVVDAIGAISSARTYDDLVIERRWSLARYERFLVASVAAFFRR